MIDVVFRTMMRERLIEERKKNADLNRELNSLSDGLRDLEAELAEARLLIRSLNAELDETR